MNIAYIWIDDPVVLDLSIFTLQSLGISAQSFNPQDTEHLDPIFVLADHFNEDKIKTFKEKFESAPIFIVSPQSWKTKLEITDTINANSLLEDLQTCIKKHFNKDNDENEQYCKISMKTLALLPQLEDDIFIQLVSGRMLKLFGAKDEVTKADVERYAAKGVHELYLKKNIAQWVIREINKNFSKNIEKIKSGEEVALDSKTKDQVEGEVQELFSFDKEFIEEVDKAVKNTISVIKKNPKLTKLLIKLKSRPEDDYFHTHVGHLCNVSCGIAKELGWNLDKTMEKLIYASFLHDITLIDFPNLANISTLQEFLINESKFSTTEKKSFLLHPQDANELVETFPDIPQDVAKLILQHHERPDGKGIPNKMGPQRVTPLSALFIIAHDITSSMMSDKNWTLDSFLEDKADYYRVGNYRKIINAIENM